MEWKSVALRAALFPLKLIANLLTKTGSSGFNMLDKNSYLWTAFRKVPTN
jgi:hypothetical protein